MPIAPNIWQQLLHTVFEMNSAGCRTAFSETVVTGLSRMITADVIVFHVLDTKSQRLLMHMIPRTPFTGEEIAYYTAHSGEHPIGDHYLRHPDAGRFASPT